MVGQAHLPPLRREYPRGVDRRGLAWTLALIDEDVELHGHPYSHALARAGVIDYAERWTDSARPTY